MLKKTVNYEDFDGNLRSEDLYFNLTKTELIDIAMELPENVTETMSEEGDKLDEGAALKMIEALGGKGVIEFIKKIVLKSYGIKSEDGRRFIKNEQITTEFSETLAYDTIVTELLTDDKKASEFVNAVIPKDIVDKIGAQGTQGAKKALPKK